MQSIAVLLLQWWLCTSCAWTVMNVMAHILVSLLRVGHVVLYDLATRCCGWQA
jgi:hypothetical protein